jgi:hypothetical protein
MREIRPYGSEGGAPGNRLLLPLSPIPYPLSPIYEKALVRTQRFSSEPPLPDGATTHEHSEREIPLEVLRLKERQRATNMQGLLEANAVLQATRESQGRVS